MVEREKWILYKHLPVTMSDKSCCTRCKNSCATDAVKQKRRYRMQDRLAALDLYRARNPKAAQVQIQ